LKAGSNLLRIPGVGHVQAREVGSAQCVDERLPGRFRGGEARVGPSVGDDTAAEGRDFRAPHQRPFVACPGLDSHAVMPVPVFRGLVVHRVHDRKRACGHVARRIMAAKKCGDLLRRSEQRQEPERADQEALRRR
jgi:hypothetical protein